MPEPLTWREVTASWWALIDWQFSNVCQLQTWTFPPSVQVTECEVNLCREASGSHYCRPWLTCARLFKQCACGTLALPQKRHHTYKNTNKPVQNVPWIWVYKWICAEIAYANYSVFVTFSVKEEKSYLTQWWCSHLPLAQNIVNSLHWMYRWI